MRAEISTVKFRSRFTVVFRLFCLYLMPLIAGWQQYLPSASCLRDGRARENEWVRQFTWLSTSMWNASYGLLFSNGSIVLKALLSLSLALSLVVIIGWHFICLITLFILFQQQTKISLMTKEKKLFSTDWSCFSPTETDRTNNNFSSDWTTSFKCPLKTNLVHAA